MQLLKRGALAAMEVFDSAQTAMLKNSVANSECFVDNEDVGFYARRYCKCKTDIHTTRVSLNGLMNELTDLGESFDVWKNRVCLTARETHQRGIHVCVLDACELRIKPGSQFKQRSDTSLMPNLTMCW